MKDMTEEKFIELVATIVKTSVEQTIAAERENFWVPPEDHYLDHQVIGKCRERNEETIIIRSFIKKLIKREKIIAGVATKGTAVAALALFADYIYRQLGLDVGLSKFMTIFK